jgi:hypothetical protein
MSDSDQAHALIVQAALEVSRDRGATNLPVALPKVLDPAQRTYLYAVSNEHPLAKEYGSGQLSAILVETKTPHLVDQKPPRKGVRYTDKALELDKRLTPFTEDTVRRAWRAETLARRTEQQEVNRIATGLAGLTLHHAEQMLPAPNSEQDLVTPSTGAISSTKPNPTGRGNSDSR